MAEHSGAPTRRLVLGRMSAWDDSMVLRWQPVRRKREAIAIRRLIAMPGRRAGGNPEGQASTWGVAHPLESLLHLAPMPCSVGRLPPRARTLSPATSIPALSSTCLPSSRIPTPNSCGSAPRRSYGSKRRWPDMACIWPTCRRQAAFLKERPSPMPPPVRFASETLMATRGMVTGICRTGCSAP